MEQLKQLLEVIIAMNKNETSVSKQEKIDDYYKEVINKRVIIRSYESGVHYGTLQSVHDNTVTLTNSRRIHYWDGANSLTDIALGGIQNKVESRVTASLDSIIVKNVNEIIPCTALAIDCLDNFPIWSLVK